MKKSYYTLILFLLILSGCNKDDDNNTVLPPATQTGEGTFACYVNGKPFIDNSGGYFNCYYQYVDGEYYFNISGIFENKNTPRTIALGTEGKTISEGETLQLVDRNAGNAWAGGSFRTSEINSAEFSFTSAESEGELTITKLDFENRIVAGIFWFDLTNPHTGQKIEIRDGRFDTLFTQ